MQLKMEFDHEITPQSPDHPPGTAVLVDLKGDLLTKHSSRQKEIVLLPTPSQDPNDPLNWSRPRKWLATACYLLFTWCICFSSSAVYSVFVPIHEETGISFDRLNEGTGYMFLLFGWGLLFWLPIALSFGRRGVYCSCLLGTCLMNVWAGYTKTEGAWVATRILIGFFGAPSEALPSVTVTDLFFTHERGTYMGLYTMALYGGQWGAVPSGFISDRFGWPWVLWTSALLNAFGFVVCFFCMEETTYHREPTAFRPSIIHNDDAKSEFVVASEEREVNTTSWPKRTYLQKLAPFRAKRSGHGGFWSNVYRPLLMLRFPGILFAGFIYGCFLNWFAMVNAVNSIILTAPPYNWSSALVGVSYVAELIGTYVAGYIAGKVADKLSIRLSRSHNGIMEPEFRLWLFGILALLAPFGLWLYGIGAAHGLNYWALLIGMVAVGFLGPAAGSLALTYVAECFQDLSGQAFIAVVLIRNTLNFAFNYGVTPWVTNMGFQNAFIVAGAVALATTLLFLPMVKFGKAIRRASAKAYWKLVEDYARPE